MDGNSYLYICLGIYVSSNHQSLVFTDLVSVFTTQCMHHQSFESKHTVTVAEKERSLVALEVENSWSTKPWVSWG